MKSLLFDGTELHSLRLFEIDESGQAVPLGWLKLEWLKIAGGPLNECARNSIAPRQGTCADSASQVGHFVFASLRLGVHARASGVRAAQRCHSAATSNSMASKGTMRASSHSKTRCTMR